MSTLVRIKRHLNEDPLDAVLLNFKKKKLEDSSENIENESVVVKFAGTINDIQEDVSKVIKQPTKIEIKEQYKKHNIDVLKKIRQQNQEASKANRLKVINSFRSNNFSEQIDGSHLNCTIVDIETDEKKSTDNKEVVSKKENFVYDLYYTNSDDFGDDLAEFISVYPLSDGLIYGSVHNSTCNQGDSDSEYSEDSNAENNWRNDYPDESDCESITDEDMIRNFNKVQLHNDDDLSSDDYDVYDAEYGCENQYENFKRQTLDDSSEFNCADDSYSP